MEYEKIELGYSQYSYMLVIDINVDEYAKLKGFTFQNLSDFENKVQKIEHADGIHISLPTTEGEVEISLYYYN